MIAKGDKSKLPGKRGGYRARRRQPTYADATKPRGDWSGVLLSNYFDSVFVPEKLRQRASMGQLNVQAIAIRWFDAFFQRPPTIKDLESLVKSESELNNLQRFMVANGRLPDTARVTVGVLIRFWRFITTQGHMAPVGYIPRLRTVEPANPATVTRTARIPKPKADHQAMDGEVSEKKTSPLPATLETPLMQFLNEHYCLCRELSTTTKRFVYAYAVKSFGEFLERPAKLADLTEPQLNTWIVWMAQRVRPHTAHGWRRVILSLWRFAYEERLLPELPRKVRRIKLPQLLPEGWDREQVGKLLATADAETGAFPRIGVERRLWWKAFITLAYFTGLRLSDVLGLKREQITVMADGRGRMTVIMGKTGNRIHRVLPPAAMQAVEAVCASGPQRELVLPLWTHRRFFYRAFKLLVNKAGLTGSTKYLRRGSASEAERIRPGAGREHLGHRSPGLFESYYRVDRIVQPEPTLPPAPDYRALPRLEQVVDGPVAIPLQFTTDPTIRAILEKSAIDRADFEYIVKFLKAMGMKVADVVRQTGISKSVLYNAGKKNSPDRFTLGKLRLAFAPASKGGAA